MNTCRLQQLWWIIKHWRLFTVRCSLVSVSEHMLLFVYCKNIVGLCLFGSLDPKDPQRAAAVNCKQSWNYNIYVLKSLWFASKGGTLPTNERFFWWVEDLFGPRKNTRHTSHRNHYLTICCGVMPKYTLEQSSADAESPACSGIAQVSHRHEGKENITQPLHKSGVTSPRLCRRGSVLEKGNEEADRLHLDCKRCLSSYYNRLLACY